MTLHAVMHFPWGCQVSSGGEQKEFQVEGETEEEIVLRVEQVLERYYGQFFKGKPQEVMLGFCEDGEAIDLNKIGDKWDVKISISMMLVPKRAGKRKAKREDDGE